MGDRRCCCAGCVDYTDDFTSADSTTVNGWNEVEGDWGIESNQLVEAYDSADGTTDAIIIYRTPVPSNSGGEMNISVRVPVADLDVNRRYHIHPACTDIDTVGPVVVEYYWDATAEEWTTAIKSGGLSIDSHTAAKTGTPSYYTLHCCCDYETGQVRAYVDPTANQLQAWATVDPGQGRYAGLGHYNEDQTHFDHFTLANLRTPDEVCVPCFCMCDDSATEPTMTATIVDATDRASCLNGQTWDMEFFHGPQMITWRGGITINGEDLNWELTCGDGGAADFTLRWLEPWNCATADGSEPANALRTADEYESTCEPIYLLFGPFVLSFSFHCNLCYSYLEPDCVIPPPGPNCSGEFWIAITL